MELNEQSKKKRQLQEKLESNLRNLQQAQILAITQPDSMNGKNGILNLYGIGTLNCKFN